MAVTPSKTNQATNGIISWTNGDLASANIYLAAALDVSTVFEATFFTKVARRTGTAFAAGWPNVRLEGTSSPASPGINAEWYPLTTIHTPAVGGSIANTTLNGAVSAGATSFVVASATGIAVGDILYLGHTTDKTKYEVVRVKATSGTTITPEEAVTYAHDTGAQVTDQAEMWADTLNLRSVSRVRGVFDNLGSGQAAACQILIMTEDSVG